MDWVLGVALITIAFLFATAGQAGGSGYLAVLSWSGMAVLFIRPTALMLNCAVALVTTITYLRAGWFSWSRFWPVTILAVPMAFLGGRVLLTGYGYDLIVAGCLLWAAIRLVGVPQSNAPHHSVPITRVAAMLSGAAIGFLSGVTGMGGGIFLTPLVVMRRWATPHQAAGITAPFILINSLAALLAHPSSVTHVPTALPFWGIGVVLSGWAGATIGSRVVSPVHIKHVLAAILALTSMTLLIP